MSASNVRFRRTARGSAVFAALLGATAAMLPATAQEAPAMPAATTTGDAVLAGVVAGEWRSAAHKSRDESRKPQAVLEFWGLKPGMSILEVQPGEGWWTQILAPYAARTGGRYSATAPDILNPTLSEAARVARQQFELRFYNPAIYGRVELVNWGPTATPLAAEQYDFILVSRSVHGWMRAEGASERNFGQLARALKPGGVLAIEQHRANPGVQDPKAASGYVTEQHVIQLAEKAGLKLAGRSEINANPKDTKDHPFGVWTLPPIRQSVPMGSKEPPAADFDRAKYDAIGESDRMTLRFVKGA
jgi:predicted methyltransferase